ncbi:MAG: transcriptional regulator GcvA [Pseudomonadota bacterium]|jgi:LysR family glycine cleavage system transcriptional activator
MMAIRAFEATARHLSVTQAAVELCVTAGAISQQVKQLEDTVGVALLQRKGRNIELTDAGVVLRPQLTQALDIMSIALDSIALTRDRKTLKLTLLPTLTEKWLMPRLARFHGAHPELDIQIMTSFRDVDLDSEGVDMASWIGMGIPTGVNGVRLFDDEFLPVCSPRLLSGAARVDRLSDLAAFTFLHSVPRSNDWHHWLELAGERDLKPVNNLSFGNSSLAIQAAIDGVGVAMVQHEYVKSHLASGSLVAPTNFIARGPNGYYLGWSSKRPAGEAFALFRDWILKEVESSKEPMAS